MGDDPVPLFLPLESPMVGYCVEMLDAPFSRYQSCNGCGECPSFSLSFPFLSFPFLMLVLSLSGQMLVFTFE